MHLRFLNNCFQLASHHEPLSARRRTVTCGWWFVGGPIVAQLYVRIGFFYKVYFVLEGVRWSGPYPPHPPKKSHVLWVSIEISIPRHPKINKKTVTPHLVRRNAARYNYFVEFQMFTGETLMRLSVCTYKTQSVTGKWAITYF